MLTYIARRILYSIPVLIVSTFLSFTFVSLAGDCVRTSWPNPQVLAAHATHLAHQYHLDSSIPSATGTGFRTSSRTSSATRCYVAADLAGHHAHDRAHGPVVVLAEVHRAHPRRRRRHLLRDPPVLGLRLHFTTLSFLGYAMPVFWLALLLQILFVDIYLKWNVRIFYTSGLNNRHGNPTWSLDRLQHIALPVITLTVISFALYSRYMRASMLDVINTDYVRTARAKGCPSGG